jgi:hypothetical protein
MRGDVREAGVAERNTKASHRDPVDSAQVDGTKEGDKDHLAIIT